jgi:hypothetical protein
MLQARGAGFWIALCMRLVGRDLGDIVQWYQFVLVYQTER